MRAAVLYSPNNISLEERDNILLSQHDRCKGALVKVEACAVCGYDVNVYRNGHDKVRTPVVLGHEVCGRILEFPAELSSKLNASVDACDTDLVEGARVVISPAVPCLHCNFCRSQRYNLCTNLGEIGSNIDGGFADYVHVPYNSLRIGGLVSIPKTLTDEESTLIEPLACCLNGFKRISSLISDLKEEQTCVIIGDGPIGLIHLQLAKYYYDAKVVMVGRVKHRLRAARNLGADFVIDYEDSGDSPNSTVKEVMDFTDGKGANISVVATPNPDAYKIAVGVASKNSVVNIFAGIHQHLGFELDPNWVHYNQIALIGSFNSTPRMIHDSIELVAEKGRIDLSSIITHTCKLDEIYKALQITEEFLGLRAVINSF